MRLYNSRYTHSTVQEIITRILMSESDHVVFLNNSGKAVSIRTYDQKDTVQLIPYAKYSVSDGQETYLKARGETFIHCWIKETKIMFTPTLGRTYVYDGDSLHPTVNVAVRVRQTPFLEQLY